MKLLPTLGMAAAAFGALTFSATDAHAGGYNDFGCKSGSPPVLLVHGQGGNVEGMGAIRDRLVGANYCVFGENWGMENGMFGRAHLDTGGQQLAAFAQKVMQATGAKKVSLVTHSAGEGVADNYILAKGGDKTVQSVVSFGGLHHPYAHLGLANIIDANIFVPSIMSAVQLLFPFVSFQDIAAGVIGAVESVGIDLPDNEANLVKSGFVGDLFDPHYWTNLHGSLSEPPGVVLSINASDRSLKTNDSRPQVCFTNIVGVGDFITGANAGFQDEAPNVENWILTSLSDHGAITWDAAALDKMLAGVKKDCSNGDDPSTPPVNGH